MEKVAFIINPFSAKKNYHPFLNELKSKVQNPLYYISESISGTDEFIKNNFGNENNFSKNHLRLLQRRVCAGGRHKIHMSDF